MTLSHHALLAAFALTLGAAVGSFLNVCIWRLPRGESLLWPRSRCPNCASPIAPRDNLPVFGWLLLRGRCRRCSWPVPARYPLVEAAVALLFAFVVAVDLALAPIDPLERGPAGAMTTLGAHLVMVSLLVLVAVIGWDERRGLAPEAGRPIGRDLIGCGLLAALAALLAGDLFGSALSALLLSAATLRAVPPRWALGRLF